MRIILNSLNDVVSTLIIISLGLLSFKSSLIVSIFLMLFAVITLDLHVYFRNKITNNF